MDEQLIAIMETLKTLCADYPTAAWMGKEITLSEQYDNYLKDLEGSGSPRAFANKVRLSKIVTSEIGHYTLRELTTNVLSRFINHLPALTYIKGTQEYLYSQSHIDKIYTSLKCVLSAAARQGLIPKNFLNDIPCPVALKFSEEREEALTDQEITMLLSAFSGKIMWYTMLVLLAYTGMRPGEVYALKFTDFDYHRNTVKVRRALSLNVTMDIDSKSTVSSHPYIKLLKNERREKKDYARRVLTVGDFVIQLVKKYEMITKSNETLSAQKTKNGTCDFLFTAPSDGQLKRPDYYCNEYRKQLQRKGINPTEYNLYRFRHTYCTRLFKNQKLDPKTVQRLMGDNDMTMVMRIYNSVNKDDIICASAEFAKSMDTSLNFVMA